MATKVSSEVEKKIQSLIETYLPEIVEGCAACSQPLIVQMKTKIRQNFSLLISCVNQDTVHQIIEKNLSYAISSKVSESVVKEEKTEWMVHIQGLETPEETQIQQNQNLEGSSVKIEEGNQINSNILSTQTFQPRVPPRNTALSTATVMNNSCKFQERIHIKKESNSQTIAKKKNQAPKMIQTQFQFRRQARRQRRVHWPLAFQARQRLASPPQTTRLMAKENRRFRRRLLKLINREIRNYRQELIEKMVFDRWKKSSQPKITSFLARRQEDSQQLIGPMVDLQQQLNNHGLIRVGNIEFSFIINGLQELQVTDFTFKDRTFELKKRELLGLKNHRFLSRVTERLPMKRKKVYEFWLTRLGLLA